MKRQQPLPKSGPSDKRTVRQRQFLAALADLCEKYTARFSYGIDDDGIHIEADGDEVFVGFLNDAAGQLRG